MKLFELMPRCIQACLAANGAILATHSFDAEPELLTDRVSLDALRILQHICLGPICW